MRFAGGRLDGDPPLGRLGVFAGRLGPFVGRWGAFVGRAGGADGVPDAGDWAFRAGAGRGACPDEPGRAAGRALPAFEVGLRTGLSFVAGLRAGSFVAGLSFRGASRLVLLLFSAIENSFHSQHPARGKSCSPREIESGIRR